MTNVRKHAREFLYRTARQDNSERIKPGILGLLGWQKAIAIAHESVAIKSGELFPASTSTVAAPRQPLKPNLTHTSLAPPIRWHLLSESVVSAYSFVALQSGVAALPNVMVNHLDSHRSDETAVFIVGGKAFRRRKPKIVAEIDTAILCGGHGAFNYYHFALECLPKVWMSNLLPDEYAAAPILLSEECRTIPQFRDLVNMVAPNKEKLYLKHGDFVGLRHCLVFDETNYGPFNLPGGHWPVPSDYYIHDACMSQFLAYLRSSALANVKPRSSCRRIFLARPQNRRSYNQDEVASLVESHGFEVVFPETLDISTQAALFNGASVLVGGSGAAWVGLAFCHDGAQALSWLPPEYSEFCSYSTLAYKNNIDLYYLNSKYTERLRSTDDAYKSSYTVDITALDRALEQIIEAASV